MGKNYPRRNYGYDKQPYLVQGYGDSNMISALINGQIFTGEQWLMQQAVIVEDEKIIHYAMSKIFLRQWIELSTCKTNA